MKKILVVFSTAFVFLTVVIVGGLWALYFHVEQTLPQFMTIKDYNPLLVSKVYDRHGKQIGEFFRERRMLVPFEKIPKNLINAFLAAEDDQFYKHGGLNYLAILRASLANLRAGKNVQGASTITQQVAKTLFLTPEKKFLRKLKEAILAHRMENNFTKDEILYLYLNQIYFGQGAYGVALAAETYFRKSLDKLSLAEIAILAGLPKAPSEYSPTHNPIKAKERQIYVLNRMVDVGFIDKAEARKVMKEPVRVFLRESYRESAPFFLETVRQMLFAKLGEDSVLEQGFQIYTSLDTTKQLVAQEALVNGLKELDKRQGYRGPLSNIGDLVEVAAFLEKAKNKLVLEERPEKIILPDGKYGDPGLSELDHNQSSKGLPFYLKLGKTVEGIVSKVDDRLGLVFVKVAEVEGVIDIETMQWARKPDPQKRYDQDRISQPSKALKEGDVILVKIAGERFDSPRLQKLLAQLKQKAGSSKMDIRWEPLGQDKSKFISLELDQEPLVEGALLSVDQDTQDILAMIGGFSFERSKYNRAFQAARQTGSSFKAIIYASALDRGYNPSSLLIDAPIVYEGQKTGKSSQRKANHERAGDEDDEGQEDAKTWKPSNHSKTFSGDITFRNALVKSLNVPTVKVIEDIGVSWAAEYARRLGIFSPLNPDFTLALGSSSVTLYEMTKVFSEFGRLGKRVHPVIIRRVLDVSGKKILDTVSLDERFSKELFLQDSQFEERRKTFLDLTDKSLPTQEPSGETSQGSTTDKAQGEELPKKAVTTEPYLFFSDPDQLIRPTTAYLITSLLKGAVEDPSGTGTRARALGREVAGKTGTTNGYFDAWFLGYTPQIATGVWVGFDQEKTLGKGEVGGRAALPIWLDYMKSAHEDLPPLTFPVPGGIAFVNVDVDTGQLPSAETKRSFRQAFLEGTEPTKASKNQQEEDTDFYKQDLSE